MATIVSQMTVDELRTLIGDVVEEKLAAILAKEDDLELADELQDLLARQDQRIKSGDRGERLEDLVARLGLE